VSETLVVFKREFIESVRTRTFLLGTLFGPVLILGLLFLPSALGGGVGERSIAIVDVAGEGLGEAVAAALRLTASDEERTVFHTEVVTIAARGEAEVRSELAARVAERSLDGYLWLPAGVMDGDSAVYEGRNATNFTELREIETAVQRAAQALRLRAVGIDPEALRDVFRLIPFEARKAGERAATGTAASAFFLAYILGFAVYLVVALYGNGVMQGVLEEKKDRIVEVVVSSIRAEQLMLGKILGIGGAGLLQVLIWTVFAALALRFGDSLAAAIGLKLPPLPDVPARVAVIFLAFFTTGFFLYAAIYAVLGAIATSDQETRQLQFPVVLLLVLTIVAVMPILNDPAGRVAVVGSLIPFCAPILMPMRAALMEVPVTELAASLALLVVAGLVAAWLGAKVYRIGILSTGRRPTLAEVWRWVRAA